MIKLTIGAALLLVLISPRTASACSCVWPGAPGSAEARTYFLGQLKEADAAFSGPMVAKDDESVTFTVEQAWKGTLAKKVLVTSGRPKGSDGFIAMDCRPALYSETRYLVFLYRQPDGSVELSRCAIWDGTDMEDRIRWLRRQQPK